MNDPEPALMHELGYFMTVLKKLLYSLVYYFAVNKFIFGKEIGNYETRSYETFFKRSCLSGNRIAVLHANPHIFQYEGP